MLKTAYYNGEAIDLILLILILEFAALSWRNRGESLRSSMIDQLFALAPGACLLLALRAALTGASWAWVAAWVTLSLPLHVGDIWRRGGPRS